MMKNTVLLLTGLLALAAAPVRAQFADEFKGKALGPLWTFAVPGSKIAASPDTTHLSVKNGTLYVTLQPGNLQQGTAHNLPTLLLAPGISGDYSIETKVSAGFDKVDGYPFAGIVVMTDPSNFVCLGIRHNNFKTATATGPANYNFASVSSILGGKVDAKKNAIDLSSNYTNLGAGPIAQPVTITLQKNGQTITFGYASANGKVGTALTLSPSDTGDKKAAYDFLRILGGKRVGLYTDTGYTKTAETVSFGYLHLSGLKPAKP